MILYIYFRNGNQLSSNLNNETDINDKIKCQDIDVKSKNRQKVLRIVFFGLRPDDKPTVNLECNKYINIIKENIGKKPVLYNSEKTAEKVEQIFAI